MAQMNQEMYGAQGKVGNKVYYRSATGKTVARELVTPKNPKTDAQTIQRVIAAQVGKSYAKFKDIADHSFEGISTGAKSMNKFRSLNQKRARERATEIQASGNSLSAYYNFQPIGSVKWVPNAVILSQGQLPQIYPAITTDELGLACGAIAIGANTYQAALNALNLKRGDQLTFVCVNKRNGNYEVSFSRIILDPRNGDGSSAALSSALISDGAVVNPSNRNSQPFACVYGFEEGNLLFSVGEGTVVAVAVIASRKSGSDWLRSNSELVISEENIGSDLCSLWDAVAESYNSASIEVESEYYLNNAGEGGSQGDLSTPDTPSTAPSYSNVATINGASQNVAGGSVSVTEPVTSIVLTGSNLADSEAYLTVDNGAHVAPAKTANALSFNDLNVAAGQTIRVYKADGQLFFTVSVTAAQSGGGESTGSMTITKVNGVNKSIGGTTAISPNTAVTITGENMSGTWKLDGNVDPSSATATQVVFAASHFAEEANHTVTFNGSNVLTIQVAEDQ